MTKHTAVTADNPVLADVVATLWMSGCYREMSLQEMIDIVSAEIPALSDLDIDDCRAAIRRRQIQIRKPKPRREPVAV